MLDTPIITTRLQVALAGLGLVAVAALAAGATGYVIGHRAAAAAGDAALSKLQRDVATAQARAAEQARIQERALTEAANRLGAQLLQERDRHAQDTQQLKRRIDRVTSQYRPAPGAPLQPLPRCVFTHGFVGVWNRAIADAGLPAADHSAGAAAAAGPDEALDSGVRQSDVLAHHADYGQRCRDIESQLNRVIDLLEGGRP